MSGGPTQAPITQPPLACSVWPVAQRPASDASSSSGPHSASGVSRLWIGQRARIDWTHGWSSGGIDEIAPMRFDQVCEAVQYVAARLGLSTAPAFLYGQSLLDRLVDLDRAGQWHDGLHLLRTGIECSWMPPVPVSRTSPPICR